MLVMIISATAWQAPLLSASPLPTRLVPVALRVTAPTMLLTGEELNTASSLLASGSTQAPSFNVLMAGACLLYAFARVFRATGVFQPASKAPSAKELQRMAGREEKLSTFGWLQADLRMPLPSWEELETACHRIGTQEGQNVYLCAHESPGCQVSADFTEHYSHPVYICDEA